MDVEPGCSRSTRERTASGCSSVDDHLDESATIHLTADIDGRNGASQSGDSGAGAHHVDFFVPHHR